MTTVEAEFCKLNLWFFVKRNTENVGAAEAEK